jgi:chromosomal replication initiator protein
LTLLRFVPTPENRSALEAVRQLVVCLAEQRRPTAELLYLHGPSGAGKTSLVGLLVEELRRRAPGITVQVLHAGEVAALVRSGGPAAAEELLAAARDCDLLILEDLQHLDRDGACSPALAETLVGLLDERQAEQRPTVATATLGPGRLTGLPQRLTSRLGGGLVVAVEPPGPASRLALLEAKAQRRQLAVSREVLAWLAEHLGGGRQLDGAIARLEALARQSPWPPGVAEVAAHFEAEVSASRPTVERIAQRVGSYYRVEPRQLVSQRRSRAVLIPRQVGMYLARRLTELSLEEIGAYFGGRDHSTVLHACRKIEAALDHDLALGGAVRQLHADLGGVEKPLVEC